MRHESSRDRRVVVGGSRVNRRVGVSLADEAGVAPAHDLSRVGRSSQRAAESEEMLGDPATSVPLKDPDDMGRRIATRVAYTAGAWPELSHRRAARRAPVEVAVGPRRARWLLDRRQRWLSA
jgi:hypothetical protein